MQLFTMQHALISQCIFASAVGLFLGFKLHNFKLNLCFAEQEKGLKVDSSIHVLDCNVFFK